MTDLKDELMDEVTGGFYGETNRLEMKCPRCSSILRFSRDSGKFDLYVCKERGCKKQWRLYHGSKELVEDPVWAPIED